MFSTEGSCVNSVKILPWRGSGTIAGYQHMTDDAPRASMMDDDGNGDDDDEEDEDDSQPANHAPSKQKLVPPPSNNFTVSLSSCYSLQ